MRNIVVTGGAGMIGSELVYQLISKGNRVVVLDDLSRGTVRNLSRAAAAAEDGQLDLVVRDVARCSSWEHLYETHGDDWAEIYHLAARIGGVGSMYARPYDQARNVCGDWETIEQALACKARLLYASTACVYPTTLQTGEKVLLLEEADVWPARPESLYGLLKLSGEEMVRAACQQYELDATCVRMFNAVGPEFCSIDSRHVIPALVGKLLAGDEELEVWGDGTAERSFLDCRDAARALQLVMDQGPLNGEAVNIGDEIRHSVKTVAETVIAHVNPYAKIRFAPSKPAGVKTRAANVDSMKGLGWHIEHDLPAMIEYTAEVLRNAT